jgi:hypothetical protein
MYLNVLESFSKNTPISNFIRIRPVGTELLHADRRTDGRTEITKLIVAFRHFACLTTILQWNYSEKLWFEVLTAVLLKIQVFWGVMPCRPMKWHGRFVLEWGLQTVRRRQRLNSVHPRRHKSSIYKRVYYRLLYCYPSQYLSQSALSRLRRRK